MSLSGMTAESSFLPSFHETHNIVVDMSNTDLGQLHVHTSGARISSYLFTYSSIQTRISQLVALLDAKSPLLEV